MCCFSGFVKRVNWTKIFGRLTGKGSQFLVYQMLYESEQENAMILPIPTRTPASNKSVRFIDLSDYDDFFMDLAFGFPWKKPISLGCGAAPTSSEAVLEVQEVGSFVASVVPSVDDFARLDPRFVIPKETWDKIPSYADYSFAVFQLKELSGRPHPMAFEFETRLDETFFPTLHIHDGEVHAEERFSHELFLQHAGLDSVASRYKGPRHHDRNTTLVRSEQSAKAFCNVDATHGIVAPELLVHKKELKGTLPNQDTLVTASGSATETTFNYRNWNWLAPWAVAISALGWFFQRRSRLRRR